MGELVVKFSGANGVSFPLEMLGKQASHTYNFGYRQSDQMKVSEVFPDDEF